MVVRTTSVALLLASVGCGDDGSSGGGGAGGSAGGGDLGGGGQAPHTVGCDGAELIGNPADSSLPGPWPVGAKTVSIGGLTAEVWYPATPGSETSREPRVYDVRSYLPASEVDKITDAKAPLQTCECFADLPLDTDHGPYPVIVFVHGTAGFRTQSLEITSHWASRGFVVVAADHPGLYLGDLIASLPMCGGVATPQDLQADLATIVSAVESPTEDLVFLAGAIDKSRIGMSGHSAGGGAIETQGGVAQVLIPMAAGGVEAGSALKSVLVLGAQEDQVVDYSSQVSGYEATVAPQKRLVGLSPGGHLTFSSLCSITNADGEDIVTIGTDADVCGLSLAGALFDCDASYMPADRGFTIVNDATSSAFEQTLHCNPDAAAALTSLAERYSEVVELREEPAP